MFGLRSENQDFVAYSMDCIPTKSQVKTEQYMITADGINEVVEIKIENDESGLTSIFEPEQTSAEYLYYSEEPETSKPKGRDNILI